MNKNIATKTDVLRVKIAKEVFGEKEDADGCVRSYPSWEIFEKTIQLNNQLKKVLLECQELRDSMAQKNQLLIGGRTNVLDCLKGLLDRIEDCNSVEDVKFIIQMKISSMLNSKILKQIEGEQNGKKN